MQIGRLRITADRWPWQRPVSWHQQLSGNLPRRYGWGTVPGMGRFGGGWNWNLGIQVGSSTVILNLLWGSVRINWLKKGA